MPWSNQSGGGSGGGPWGQRGSGGKSPWGSGPQGGGTPPDLEDILRRGQDRLKDLLPGGGSMGGKGALAILLGVVAIWLVYRKPKTLTHGGLTYRRRRDGSFSDDAGRDAGRPSFAFRVRGGTASARAGPPQRR